MNGDWRQRASEGITVFRASRLEALLQPLDYLLGEQRPDGLLTPQTVIAAHPGMRHWLSGALARHRGGEGIVANVDILLPSTFLDRLAVEVLGQEATSPAAWRRPQLRWRLFELLAEPPDPSLRESLAGPDSERRRFQLADRLARIYSRYMAYRPDWLAEWARGRAAFGEAGFHPALWQALGRQVQEPHRGERLAELARRLRGDKLRLAASDPLHVFGLSHLAPAELAVLQALAVHRPVVFYLPDPCREYWGGLVSDRARLRALAEAPFGSEAETVFLQQHHPLLAAWGRLGQHFMLQMQSLDARLDLRHFRDERDHDEPPKDLLERLQESIRRLEPALLSGDGRTQEERRADASLRVHRCHTRLRELEALRDALLLARRDDPTIEPQDMVVMAPNIADYLPLLPAVFGAPGDPEAPLPYHLADVPVARARPLFNAFRQLLALPGSRATATDLMDFVAQPDVARRLGLDEDGLALLENALARARAAWGLDPATRAAQGVPDTPEHTLAWAMDRLLASHVHGEQAPEAVLQVGADRIAPVPGIGNVGAVLGALDHLLQQLAQLRADAAAPRKASAWAQRLEATLEALFQPDPEDPSSREAMDELRGLLRRLASEPGEAGLDPEIGFPVVRQYLEEAMAAVPERQRFLAGGVTVCGMVPQRAIPFRVVAVLGLNEGEYPRRDSDAGLDPIGRPGLRRLGDRDVRSDDRYLFLETVMSARDRLHLSYVAFDAKDGSARNPAAPLAELMAALPRSDWQDPLEPEAEPSPAWQVTHPLQPFDEACFGADPARRTFSWEFAAMVGGEADRPTLLWPELPPPPAGPSVIELERLMRWARDPARMVLAEGLRARLDGLGERGLPEDEPLEVRLDFLDRQARQLCERALSDPEFSLDEPPPEHLRLAGVLPAGALGAKTWRKEQELAQRLVDAARGRKDAAELFTPILAPAAQPAIARQVGRHTLLGELDNVRGRDGWLFVFAGFAHREKEADLGFRERLPLYLAWALCRLAPENAKRHVRVVALTTKPGDSMPWQRALAEWDEAFLAAEAGERARMRAVLETKLAFLLDAATMAPAQPWPWFPRTSWALANDPDKAADAWKRERSWAPSYAQLLGRGIDLDADDRWRGVLGEAAQLMWQAMQPWEQPA